MRELLAKLEEIGRATLGIVGILVLSISSFVVTWAGVELTAPGFQPGALLIAAAVSASLFALTGLVLFWRGMVAGGSPEERLDRRRQQDLLDAAKQRGGRVTVAELALHTSYSVDEVGEQLDAFVDEGIAEIGVSDRGREVFMFPEFEQEDDKLTADDPLRTEVEAVFDDFDRDESEEQLRREVREVERTSTADGDGTETD